MAKKKKVDVLDILPPEAMAAADKQAYAFLCEHGYDAEGAEGDEGKRKALMAELSRRGECIKYSGMFDPEAGKILVWFHLWRGKKRIARSKGYTFILRGGHSNE